MMKKILFLSALFLTLLATGGCSQQKGPRDQHSPEQQAENMIERLNNELQLTEQQQSELKTYFTDSFKKRNESFKKEKENREQMREQMKKEREAMDAQLKKVLTEEQYNTYKENEKKRREEWGRKRRPEGPDQAPMERRRRR
ncbi:DUF4890 domain-containing protein [Odoribacter lunatus]|uniref:DUF4890 domain-containing protein n=1 Tax=Odoribacter lunatus TaxID=2941335 RepID=UPI00203AB164|nr:DUF4890 domain-containing protein [Odoribacter lunatus]